jgi:hypothetical protein
MFGLNESLNSKLWLGGALKTILRFTAKMLIDVQFNNMF